MLEIEGLDESEYWDRNGLQDHWKGSYTRGSPKGRIEVSWNHVSPSQIESFSKCKRLWLFKSILKIPEGQKGHQSLGEAFHLIMEKVPKGLTYDKSDVGASPEDWEKAEQMAKQGLPLLPPDPKQVFKREQGIRLETYDGGPTMVGYIDLGIPSGHGWPSFMIPVNEAIVADYKTLSDFRYMKTPQELAESVQMMTYAKWAIEPYPLGLHGENDPLPEHVRLLHMYARTKAPFTRSTIRHESAIVTPSEINSRWNKTLDIVREMQQLSTCTNPEDVEAGGALNGHCEAYGGCHFRDKCGISKSSGIKTLFQIGKKPATQEQTEMSGSAILDKIKAAREAANKTATPSPSATVSSTPATNPVMTGPSNTPVGPVAVDNQSATVNPSTTGSPVASGPETVSGSANLVVKGPVSGLMAKIMKGGKGQPQLTGSIAQSFTKETGAPAVASGELAKTQVATLGELMKLATGVVPPDAPPRIQPVITKPGDAVVDPLKTMVPGEGDEDDEEDGQDDSSPTSASNAVVSGASSVVVDNVDAPKKRGRPSAAEVAAREAAAKKAFDDAVNAEVAKRLSSTDTTPIASDDAYLVGIRAKGELDALQGAYESLQETNRKLLEENERLTKERSSSVLPSATQEGFTLYVDCFPTKGDAPTDFFEWIGPICRVVAESNGVGDWRQINYTAKGLLANAIRETVKGEGLPKAMVVSSFSGGADIALEILTPLAKRVIKKI